MNDGLQTGVKTCYENLEYTVKFPVLSLFTLRIFSLIELFLSRSGHLVSAQKFIHSNITVKHAEE